MLGGRAAGVYSNQQLFFFCPNSGSIKPDAEPSAVRLFMKKLRSRKSAAAFECCVQAVRSGALRFCCVQGLCSSAAFWGCVQVLRSGRAFRRCVQAALRSAAGCLAMMDMRPNLSGLRCQTFQERNESTFGFLPSGGLELICGALDGFHQTRS